MNDKELKILKDAERRLQKYERRRGDLTPAERVEFRELQRRVQRHTHRKMG
jgi:hypothetical protein